MYQSSELYRIIYNKQQINKNGNSKILIKLSTCNLFTCTEKIRISARVLTSGTCHKFERKNILTHADMVSKCNSGAKERYIVQLICHLPCKLLT